MINLTIDGRNIQAEEGQVILDAAREAGIYIPTLCHNESLPAYGACRLCIVKVDGMRGLPTACTTTVADGMTIQSDTEEINSIRRDIVELLIADHPTDCLTCSSNQRCELQKIAADLGIAETRLRREPKPPDIDDSNPFFTVDLAKCVLCGRCVRVCHSVRGVGAIDFTGRGYDTKVRPADGLMADSVCESCGECVAACPVGALALKGEILPPSREVTTTCPYCGVGCQLDLHVDPDRLTVTLTVDLRGDIAGGFESMYESYFGGMNGESDEEMFKAFSYFNQWFEQDLQLTSPLEVFLYLGGSPCLPSGARGSAAWPRAGGQVCFQRCAELLQKTKAASFRFPAG